MYGMIIYSTINYLMESALICNRFDFVLIHFNFLMEGIITVNSNRGSMTYSINMEPVYSINMAFNRHMSKDTFSFFHCVFRIILYMR
jgi:hypothetical protein